MLLEKLKNFNQFYDTVLENHTMFERVTMSNIANFVSKGDVIGLQKFLEEKKVGSNIWPNAFNSSKDYHSSYNLIELCKANDHYKMIKFLLSEGIQSNKSLWNSVLSNNKKMCKFLLENGVSTEEKDMDKDCIWISIKYNYYEVFTLLLQYRKDVNSKNIKGRTSIYSCCESTKNTTKYAEKLVEKGALIDNIKDKEGLTPLHYAILFNNRVMAEYLLTQGTSYKNFVKGIGTEYEAAKKIEIPIDEILLKNKLIKDTTSVIRNSQIF